MIKTRIQKNATITAILRLTAENEVDVVVHIVDVVVRKQRTSTTK